MIMRLKTTHCISGHLKSGGRRRTPGTGLRLKRSKPSSAAVRWNMTRSISRLWPNSKTGARKIQRIFPRRSRRRRDVHSVTVTDKEGGTVREFESAGDDEGVDWLSEKADKTNANFVLVRTEMQRGLLAESKILIPRLLAKALITDPYHLRLCMDLDATDIEDDVVGKLGKAFLDSPALKGTGVKKLCDFPDSLTSFVETLAAANAAKYEEGCFDFAIDCEGRYETDSKGEDFCAFDLRGKVQKRISL